MKNSEAPSPTLFENFKGSIFVASPGRINLIGEHTDYNSGFVMPTAIDKKIFFEFRKNETENTANIFSKTFKTTFAFDLSNFSKSSNSWENYILGVINEIQKSGKELKGFDCIIKSELPIGAGISSSAALECGLASGLNELFELDLSKNDIVTLSQKAENNFVGSNCGIMDQYASVMSKEKKFILLDCQSLEAEFIDADLKNCRILLLNTNVAHSLADSEYNTRRQECEEAVRIIKKSNPEVNSLRDISFELLEENKSNLPEVNYRRSLYVLKENQRVLEAAKAIKAGKLTEFGKLMYQSHEGLQHDYEVSCPELDFLVDFSRDQKFIYGSRMMGGGFGGCTINIIEEEKVEEYVQKVAKAYHEQFDIELDAINVLPGPGTKVSKIKKG